MKSFNDWLHHNDGEHYEALREEFFEGGGEPGGFLDWAETKYEVEVADVERKAAQLAGPNHSNEPARTTDVGDVAPPPILTEPLTIILEGGGLDVLNNSMKAFHALLRGAGLPLDEFKRLEKASHDADGKLAFWIGVEALKFLDAQKARRGAPKQ
ncbi:MULTISPECIES: hypothetical protein [Pseudomonas]|uniref:Uncharacterized protein n=3 Tax=Pseudomonas TaxID=286 RepID=A0A7X1GJE8_9PSED|nr:MULTISPECIES: hypothetical protein [Pseudomonas]MBC2693552.1 hypothetical protein [Pseudomonas kielensis]MDD1011030.1 hypothetical protein [Pseudomonas shahriarae]